MKKIILILLLFLFFVQVINAQIFRERQRNSYIGFRAGYSLATLSGLVYDYPGIEVTPISGYHAGFFVSVRVADNLTIEPGAYYSLKGWEMSGELDDGQGTLVEGTLTNKVSYLDAPLMLRIFLKGLNFGIGPQFSMPFKSTVDEVGTINGITVSDSYENTNDINDFDVALALAIGYEFDFGLNINATYDIGLTDAHAIYPYPNDFPYWTEARNRVVKLSLAIVLY